VCVCSCESVGGMLVKVTASPSVSDYKEFCPLLISWGGGGEEEGGGLTWGKSDGSHTFTLGGIASPLCGGREGRGGKTGEKGEEV
jgi:hypothetical protein